ncbi:MAG: TonB-dependent receptor plug domain-containing protein [Caulobacteraceae bacterium]
MKTLLLSGSTLVLAAAAATAASAQGAATVPPGATGDAIEAVVVTGTRTTGLRAVDSPAPVQVLGNDILKRTGSIDLVQSLAANVPSLQAQFNGGDQEEFTMSYKLRGLSPNDTLVLINGVRRHPSANIAVGGGPFGGGQAPDIAFIPPGAIDHVEVLTDGAAAQYGTDAIAGVVNIILKKNNRGGSISAQGGQYYKNDGLQTDLSINLGLAPTDKSFVNMTFESKYHGLSFFGDVDPRVVIRSATDTTNTTRLANYPLIKTFPFYPYVNRIAGDGQAQQQNFLFNAGYDVTPDIQFFSFGSIGYHDGRGYENYRVPTAVVSKAGVPFYPAGFEPMENNRDTDYALTIGAKGNIGSDTTWSIQSVYGRDYERIWVLGSGNADLYYDTGKTPTNFHDGDFTNTQWTNTVDLTRTLPLWGMPEPMTLAAGAEYRIDSYQIKAGDPASYYASGAPLGNGGGAQSFYGYGPSDAGYHQRQNLAGYFDFALTPIKGLKFDGAVRYESYSDFGEATVVKATARYDVNEMIAFRGTASTGFRAPSLGEEFYSGINVGPTSIGGIFAPNSSGAKFLGLSGLRPETSTNYSVGVVTHFVPRLTMTVDAYSINIENRIVMSGSFYGFNAAGGTVSPSVLQALAAIGVPTPPSILNATSGSVSVQSFVNGAATLTRGVDFLATYPMDYGAWGHVDYSLSANYSNTGVSSVNKPPSNVNQAVQLLDQTAIADMTTASPKYRFTFSGYWTKGPFSLNLRENFYGASYQVQQNDATGDYQKIPIDATATTDIELSYEVIHGVKLSAGANNAFNAFPTKEPLSYRQAQFNANDNGYVGSLYPGSSPFGVNGGFYYGRVTWSF